VNNEIQEEAIKNLGELVKDGKKIILFGSGINGISILDRMLSAGIEPAYFVDNYSTSLVDEDENKKKFITSTSGKSYPVMHPGVLESENIDEIKIIITPTVYYEDIYEQLVEMELASCVLHSSADEMITCPSFGSLIYSGNHVRFCCISSDVPKFPILSTAKETVENFIAKRDNIILELNGQKKIEDAKQCIGCRYLCKVSKHSYTHYVKRVALAGSLPCNAKCIYCPPASDCDKPVQYYDMFVQIVEYIKNNDLFDDKARFTCGSGEITFFPNGKRVLDAVSSYRSRFLTNAFKFEPKIAESMSKNNSILNVSLDSGCRDTFKIVKGFDLFDRVINNLIKYRQHGIVELKYIIMPGINDKQEDIAGIRTVMEKLSISNIKFCSDVYMPVRASYFPLSRFVQHLKAEELDYSLTTSYNIRLFGMYINRLSEVRSEDENKNNYLRGKFKGKFINDYEGYKKFVYLVETRNLIECLGGGRVVMLGYDKLVHPRIRAGLVPALKKLRITVPYDEITFEQSYDNLRDSADIFILPDYRSFKHMKNYVESVGGTSSQLCNINDYFNSPLSPREWVEKNLLLK